MKERGFILRRFLPKKRKCSVFTLGRGKIDLTFSSDRDAQRLWPGMQISFMPVLASTRVYFGNELEIITVPTSIDHSCLGLIHHLLEICYYFMPLEDLSENVFAYIEHMFIVLSEKGELVSRSALAHRLCAIGLLMECGFFPPQKIVAILALFVQELFAFVDFPKKASVQSLEKVINLAGTMPSKIFDEWIQSCARQHPCAHNFKIFI